MSPVTIQFNGICTFVSKATVPELPTPLRAVLMNASTGLNVRGIPIGSHVATVQIGTLSDPGPMLALEGCLVTIALQSGSEPLTLTPSFENLPNLTKLMQPLEPLGDPSPVVVLDADPEIVAAYFDLSCGVVRADFPLGAATTTVVIEGQPLVLTVAAFPNAPPPVVETMELLPGTLVTVSNLDSAKVIGPNAADFLVHYLTAEALPLIPQVPQDCALFDMSAEGQPVSMHVGAGCSNSTYP